MPVVEDVICTFCGCLCDDLIVEVEGDKVAKVEKACRLGAAKLLGHERIKSPMIRVNGELKEVSYDEAIAKAAEILKEAKRPLLYGWCSTSCEAQSVGIELAFESGGIIDSTATVCHGPTVEAVQERGAPGASLGMGKNYADVVLFWGCNPVHAHPRHMSRYSVFPKGYFTKKGRKDRTIIVVDVRETHTARMADIFVKVKPGHDFALISAIRAFVNGFGEVVPDEVGGVPKAQIEEVANVLLGAKYGQLYSGLGITHNRGRYKNVDNAFSLIGDLNTKTKWTSCAMRGHYNVTGIGQVLAWETGYPMSVDFARGVPHYSPGETGANDLLQRDEVDAALCIAADMGAHFPGSSLKPLARIPVIQIEPYANPTTEFADVVIPPAIAGIECEGTAYRMDGVNLRLRQVVDSDLPSDEEILKRIVKKMEA